MTTVLVAEDNDELREVYELWFQERGWRVRSAEDGDVAMDLIDDQIDIAVLDRRMPGTVGEEVARTLRSMDTDCGIVMVSAFQADGNLDGSEYDEYLVKPVDKESLVQTVMETSDLARID